MLSTGVYLSPNHDGGTVFEGALEGRFRPQSLIVFGIAENIAFIAKHNLWPVPSPVF